MENLKIAIPPWWNDGEDHAVRAPTSRGLLDGLPAPYAGSSLHLFLDPKDIATISGLSGAAGGQRQGATTPLTIGQVDPDHLVPGRPDGDYLPASGPKNPIGPVKGYPETGRDAWRAGNDDVIVAAAEKYNSSNGYFPGDVDNMTPQLMKSWMMQESGGHRRAFETDPFQVNVRKDWAAEKQKIAGLTKGQSMTPQASAEAALKWARYKSMWPGLKLSSPLARKAHYGTYEALSNYNGNSQNVDYASDILNRAWASYGDWQK